MPGDRGAARSEYWTVAVVGLRTLQFADVVLGARAAALGGACLRSYMRSIAERYYGRWGSAHVKPQIPRVRVFRLRVHVRGVKNKHWRRLAFLCVLVSPSPPLPMVLHAGAYPASLAAG
jgi:hypothetical protein